MKNFKDFLIEVKNNTDKHDNAPKTKDNNLTFTFGRFNPPHIGHEKLVNSVHKNSKGGDYRIYASQSQDPKKNPLHPEEKIGHMKHMFPDHANNIHSNANNVFDILKGAHKEGYHSVNIVVGADRVKEFEHLANKYNGSDMYNFKKIKVTSAGERHDEEDGGVEGMSASKMRKHATSNDHENFHAGMPSHVDPKYSKELMTTVQKRMSEGNKKKKTTTKESVELWEIAPKLDRESLRENYLTGNVFQIGSYVQHLDTGISGKVIHRGTNYVIYVDENNNSYRGWLTQLNEGANPKTQWKIGTDHYRKEVQKLTPGQPVKKFSDFSAAGTNSAIWTIKYQLKDTGAKYYHDFVTGITQKEALIKAKAKLTTAKIVGLPQRYK